MSSTVSVRTVSGRVCRYVDRDCCFPCNYLNEYGDVCLCRRHGNPLGFMRGRTKREAVRSPIWNKHARS